jgi:VanZ family protein
MPWLWAMAVTVWAVLLWRLSSRPIGVPVPSIPHWDKAAHLLYFTCGSFCFCRLLHLLRPAWSRRTLVLATVAFATSVGALDEFHQSFVPGRSGNDPWDWLADTLGGLTGALIYMLWMPRRAGNDG